MLRSCTRVSQPCCQLMKFSTATIAQACKRTKSHIALPVPSNTKPSVVVPEDHALWGFFRDREVLTPPATDKKHGRSWAAEELRRKSFDDLHALWIICLKERNIIATQRHERRRQRLGDAGKAEAEERDKTIKRTMAGIKFVLNERFLAYIEALELAKKDDSISLSPEILGNTRKTQSTKVVDRR